MQEILKIFIGIGFLLLAIPIGSYLAAKTREELKAGQRWFKLLIIISMIGSIISLIIRNDFLFFSFLFIALITSRNLKSNVREKN
jgi:uncharacterized membrane protein YfcA